MAIVQINSFLLKDVMLKPKLFFFFFWKTCQFWCSCRQERSLWPAGSQGEKVMRVRWEEYPTAMHCLVAGATYQGQNEDAQAPELWDWGQAALCSPKGALEWG